MGGNVEVVHSAYAAFGRGDIPALVELLDDAVQWSSPRTLPQGGEFSGKEGVLEFFQGVGGAWESLDIDVESVGDLGAGLVTAVVHGSGSLRAGGPAEYGATHAFTLEDGKITSFREYVDLDRALVA